MYQETIRNVRRLSRVASVVVSSALPLLACSSGNGAGSSSSGSSSNNAGGTCANPTDVVITDDTNYTLSDSFTIPVSTLKDNTDLVIDWSQLTTDFFGKSVDPAKDIDTVLISLWHQTPEQIQDALKADSLPMTTLVGAITTFPDGTYTSKDLVNFNLLGNSLPMAQLWGYFDTSNPSFNYPQTEYTFLVMASTGNVVGKNARMLSLFHIDPTATQTTLDITNDSTKLAYTVDLADAKPVYVPASHPAVTIDWSQMTKNSLGNRYIYSEITQVAVAHYAAASVSDLEHQFLKLQDIADGWWTGPVAAGSSLDLSTLVDASGHAFPGVDSTGIWLAALFCTENCNNPAPWSITFLKPCSQ
jgi:hypothetical protein